jgi:glutathione S-transferase
MKLYDDTDPAPNPRRVRLLIIEKKITDIELVPTPITKRAHKAPEHVARNPLGQIPTLELDDGTFISESISICRYLEELHPEPNLFGRDAKERAVIDMWLRRAEMRLMVPLGQVWVHTHPFTAAVATQGFGKQFTEFGEANRKVFAGACRVFDTELAARQFIAADRYTMADIVMQTTFDFGRFIGVDIADEHQNLKAWYARVSARPGATFNVPDNVMAIARQKKQ